MAETDFGLHGLTSAVVSNTSSIASLKTSYNTLNNTVSKITTTGDITSLRTSYNTLNSTVAGLKTSYNTLNSTAAGLKTSYNTLNSTAAGLKTQYNQLYNNITYSIMPGYNLSGYYASIIGWSSLTPLSPGFGWTYLSGAFSPKYGNGVVIGTSQPTFIDVLTECSSYGKRLIARENGATIDVNTVYTSAYKGFTLTGLCVDINSSGEPCVVAYSAFIINNNGELHLASQVKKHNLYSI